MQFFDTAEPNFGIRLIFSGLVPRTIRVTNQRPSEHHDLFFLLPPSSLEAFLSGSSLKFSRLPLNRFCFWGRVSSCPFVLHQLVDVVVAFVVDLGPSSSIGSSYDSRPISLKFFDCN
uniref:(northern house mosquito) hypothetical protein n=1 Tax=Culex pipiens TaxID=7175 RepID=A0A8D7ZYB0_CULPI